MEVDGESSTYHALITTSVPHRRSARLASAAASAQMGSVKEITPPIVGTRKRRKINEKIQDTDNGHAAVEATTAVSEDVSVEIKDPVAEPPVVISPTKPKKRRAPKEEPVYIVPDVEKKETTFSGRLGYACLNTILRNKKPVDQSIFCSRTCRIDSLKKNSELAKELGRKNIEDLLTIIQWNEDNNIRFFRLSSEMFPYASHQTYGYSLDYCADILAKAGDLAKKYGHRLTTHPGQFTQLGSPKPGVVEAALRDLAYHCQMLDLMGMGPDSVMIIHGGGVYGDKPSTVERLKQAIRDLPINIRQRLVLENDEMCYNAEDLLPICEELDVPLVFDYHHHNIYPCSFSPATIIERTNAIFARRGIKPKQHLSEPRPGAVTVMERRAHADRCENLPPDLPDNMDLMIEAKDKEQAVLYLHRMYDLQPVNYKSLRPATENPSMHTQGRKSTKRARAKAANGPASDYE